MLTLDELDRFWVRVERGKGCWNWLGTKNKDGYGQFRLRGVRYMAHRIAYMLKYGRFDDELLVMHKCDNPPCVRPSHLQLGTNQDNVNDMHQKLRHPKSKISLKLKTLLPELKRRRELGATYSSLSKEFGICSRAIREGIDGV